MFRGKSFCPGVGGAGRKGRLVAFEPGTDMVESWLKILAGIHLTGLPDNERYFWLYLLSPADIEPAYNKKGPVLLPGNVRLSTEQLPGNVRLVDRTDPLPDGPYIRCVSAVTGPPVILGGMDMVRGTSRANNAYVPAGSAWLLEIHGKSPDHTHQILREFNNTHRLGDPDKAVFGFGHTLVGIGPEKRSMPMENTTNSAGRASVWKKRS